MNNFLTILATFLAKVFQSLLEARMAHKAKVELGRAKANNEAHEQNAKAKDAADKVLAEDLPLGEDLIDALKNDSGIND